MKESRSDLSSRLWELARLFLWLGLTSFGGPAAHTALMEAEFVRRRGWLTHQEFLDLWGAANLIPGPNSTELAIHIGHRRAGWAGWLVAGICFIVPAAILVTALAWGYQRYGKLPETAAVLYGVKPVIMAVIVQALWNLGRKAVKSRGLAAAALAGALLDALGVHELAVLFGVGLAMWVMAAGWGRKREMGVPGLALVGGLAPGAWVGATAVGPAVPFALGTLFWFFLKVGSVLFGSGYVLLAFLRAELVERWHWLSEAQLLDAIAAGQITPGPVFTTATFIGYLLGGVPGAVVATVGIFLPAFVFVGMSSWLVPKLRASAGASAFLDGVNVASLSLMGVVTWQLGVNSLRDLPAVLLAVGSLGLLVWWRVNACWLMLVGAGVGLFFHRG